MSAIATLIGAVGPIAYAVFQSQIAKTVESSSATYVTMILSLFLFVICCWLWRRIYGTIYYGPTSRIDAKIVESRNLKK